MVGCEYVVNAFDGILVVDEVLSVNQKELLCDYDKVTGALSEHQR